MFLPPWSPCEVFFWLCEEEGGRVSRFWLHPFASVLLFSGSHRRFLLSIFSPSSSLASSSTSSHPSTMPPSIEPQDSQCTIGEVGAGAMKLSGDGAATDLATPEVIVTIASGPSEGLASASGRSLWSFLLCLGQPLLLLLLPPAVLLLPMTWCSSSMPLIDYQN